MRASCSGSSAIASSATSTSMPWRAMNSSMRSKSASARPSSSTTRPSRTTSEAGGSLGLANAIRPRSGSSATRLSRLIGRVAKNAERSDDACSWAARRGAYRLRVAALQARRPPGAPAMLSHGPVRHPAPLRRAARCGRSPRGTSRRGRATTRAAAGGACPAGNLHVTLVFLGATPEERLPEIGEAMRETLRRRAARRPTTSRGCGGSAPCSRAVLEPRDAGAEQLAARPGRAGAAAGAGGGAAVAAARDARPRARGTSRPRVPDSALPPLELDLAEVVLFVVGARRGGRPLPAAGLGSAQAAGLAIRCVR